MTKLFINNTESSAILIENYRITVYPLNTGEWRTVIWLQITIDDESNKKVGSIKLQRVLDIRNEIPYSTLFSGDASEAEEKFNEIKEDVLQQKSGSFSSENKKPHKVSSRLTKDDTQNHSGHLVRSSSPTNIDDLPKNRHPNLTMGHTGLILGGAIFGAVFMGMLFDAPWDNSNHRHADQKAAIIENQVQNSEELGRSLGKTATQDEETMTQEEQEALDQMAQMILSGQMGDMSGTPSGPMGAGMPPGGMPPGIDGGGIPGNIPGNIPGGIPNMPDLSPSPPSQAPSGPDDNTLCDDGDETCDLDDESRSLDIDLNNMAPVDDLDETNAQQEAPSVQSDRDSKDDEDLSLDATETPDREEGDMNGMTDRILSGLSHTETPTQGEPRPTQQAAEDTSYSGDLVSLMEQAVAESDDPEAVITQLGRVQSTLDGGNNLTPGMLTGLPSYLVDEMKRTGIVETEETPTQTDRLVELKNDVIPTNKRGVPTVPKENMWIYQQGNILLPLPGGGTINSSEDIENFGLQP